MLRWIVPVMACLLPLNAAATEADKAVTFDVTGSFGTPAGTPLSGIITVDETSVTVTAADLVVTGIAEHFNVPISTAPTAPPGVYAVTIDNVLGQRLIFKIDNLASATGGAIVSGSVAPPPCDPTVAACMVFSYQNLADSLTGTYARKGAAPVR